MKKYGLALLFTLTSSLVFAEGAGSYLALRHAYFNADDQEVSKYLEEGLKAEPNSRPLLEEAVLSAIYHQDIEKAAAYVNRLEEAEHNSLVTKIINFAAHISNNRFSEAADYVEANDELAFVSPEVIRAWAAQKGGNPIEAYQLLDRAAEAQKEWLPIFQYQKAMIAAYNKDYKKAAELIEAGGNPLYFSDMSFYNHIYALKAAGDEQYRQLLEEQFGKEALWPDLAYQLIEQEEEGTVDQALGFAKPQNAITEYLEFIIMELRNSNLDYGVERLLTTLVPAIADNDWQRRNLIEYFMRREEYDDVILFASKISPNSLFKTERDDFRMGAYFALDNEAKVEDIAATLPDKYLNQLSLRADTFRRLSQFEKAAAEYEKLIAISGRDNPRLTGAIYGMGICYERLGKWEEAETAFRDALKLEPESPNILNYLGYSLVDRGEKLDEGLELIGKAVEAAPNEGYIIDSLGWAYYRLGRYEEALQPLENAVSLMSTDPTVNSHLGDLYWKLDRKREAYFQWQRALQFVTDDSADVTREEIEARLASGLPD